MGKFKLNLKYRKTVLVTIVAALFLLFQNCGEVHLKDLQSVIQEITTSSIEVTTTLATTTTADQSTTTNQTSTTNGSSTTTGPTTTAWQPPTGMTTSTFYPQDPYGHPGDIIHLNPGQILTVPLPDTDDLSLQIDIAEGPGSPQPSNMEATISLNPGFIDTRPLSEIALEYRQYCQYRTTFSYAALIAVTVPHSPYLDDRSSAASSLCFAPKSAGQWYLNVRWNYTCPPEYPNCGFHVVLYHGSY
jgi:hypothetical protein